MVATPCHLLQVDEAETREFTGMSDQASAMAFETPERASLAHAIAAYAKARADAENAARRVAGHWWQLPGRKVARMPTRHAGALTA
jgi:hypothetical protein